MVLQELVALKKLHHGGEEMGVGLVSHHPSAGHNFELTTVQQPEKIRIFWRSQKNKIPITKIFEKSWGYENFEKLMSIYEFWESGRHKNLKKYIFLKNQGLRKFYK